jgi:hypothetical protein
MSPVIACSVEYDRKILKVRRDRFRGGKARLGIRRRPSRNPNHDQSGGNSEKSNLVYLKPLLFDIVSSWIVCL